MQKIPFNFSKERFLIQAFNEAYKPEPLKSEQSTEGKEAGLKAPSAAAESPDSARRELNKKYSDTLATGDIRVASGEKVGDKFCEPADIPSCKMEDLMSNPEARKKFPDILLAYALNNPNIPSEYIEQALKNIPDTDPRRIRQYTSLLTGKEDPVALKREQAMMS